MRLGTMVVSASLLLAGTALEGVATVPVEEAPPNILLELVDDLGCRDLAGEGHQRHRTPALDALRAGSVRFTHAATNAPNCAPSRAALVTGRHGTRTGVHTVGNPNRGKAEDRLLDAPANRSLLEDSERTIAEILHDEGYRTGFVGKWHLGLDPTTDGFDENVAGGRAGHPKSYSPPYRNAALEDGPEGEYLVDRLGAETASMIARFEEARAEDERPWFVMYAPYAVHTPIQAPEDAVAAVKARHPGLSDRNARYQVMVERTDAAIAAVLAEVDPATTIVCLASDNGGLQPVTDMAPWRGGKGMLYEGGIRTPLWVRGPGFTPRDEPMPVQLFDLMPTLVELAGASRPDDRAIDARALSPALRGEAFERGPLFWHFPAYLEGRDAESREPERRFRTTPGGAIRDGRWKLIEWYEDGAVELYDLEADPGEANDLAGSEPATRDRLHARLRGWRAGMAAPMPTPIAAPAATDVD